MGKFDDIGRSYFEGLAADKFGMDWRQKRALLEAQTNQTNAATTKLGADTLQTQAQTKKVGVETQDAEFDLGEKKRKLAELQQLVKDKRLPATQLDAINGLIAIAQQDIAKQDAGLRLKAAPGQRALTAAQTAHFNAEAENAGPKGVTSTVVMDGQGHPVVVNTPKKVGSYPVDVGGTPGVLPADARQARNLAGQATIVEALIPKVEESIAVLEDSYKGLGRVTPGFMSPNKALALRDYQMNINALATPFGRLLGDNRISDQDRASYSAALGEPSQWYQILDPTRMRKRLQIAKTVLADARRKYSAVAPDLFSTDGSAAGTGPAQPNRRQGAPAPMGNAGGGATLCFDTEGNATQCQ